MFFGMIVKDEHANLMVEFGMEGGLRLWYNRKQLLSLLPLHQVLLLQ